MLFLPCWEPFPCLSCGLGSMARVLCRCLLRFPALRSLDCCSLKAWALCDITVIKAILTANTPVDVKVRLDSCWPGEEKWYCHRYWFGSAGSSARGKSSLLLDCCAWRDEVGGEDGA